MKEGREEEKRKIGGIKKRRKFDRRAKQWKGEEKSEERRKGGMRKRRKGGT